MQEQVRFDRAIEDLGNVVGLEHVNTRVPDQHLATLFYVMGLGLTRDPYLMTGVNNMWINCGRSQFHLPTGSPQVLRGHTGLVMPGREALIQRLENVRKQLEGTKFSCAAKGDYVEATCPWGNRIRVYEPVSKYGRQQLGMPYVQFDVPKGTSDGIVRFYNHVIGTPGAVIEDGEGKAARIAVGADQALVFRETDTAVDPNFDGHHIAVYIADFSGPYKKLLARDLITREDDQHQYRFQDIYDPKDGRVLFTIEHEVRSLFHPLYNRPFVNRNPMQSNQRFAAGYEQQSWAMPLGA